MINEITHISLIRKNIINNRTWNQKLAHVIEKLQSLSGSSARCVHIFQLLAEMYNFASDRINLLV